MEKILSQEDLQPHLSGVDDVNKAIQKFTESINELSKKGIDHKTLQTLQDEGSTIMHVIQNKINNILYLKVKGDATACDARAIVDKLLECKEKLIKADMDIFKHVNNRYPCSYP